jgi:hypothetical protein
VAEATRPQTAVNFLNTPTPPSVHPLRRGSRTIWYRLLVVNFEDHRPPTALTLLPKVSSLPCTAAPHARPRRLSPAPAAHPPLSTPTPPAILSDTSLLVHASGCASGSSSSGGGGAGGDVSVRDETLEQHIASSPFHAAPHVALIDALQNAGPSHCEQLAAARERMAANTALAPGLWLQWIDDQGRLCFCGQLHAAPPTQVVVAGGCRRCAMPPPRSLCVILHSAVLKDIRCTIAYVGPRWRSCLCRRLHSTLPLPISCMQNFPPATKSRRAPSFGAKIPWPR